MKEKLVDLLNNSHSPYSNFAVSAILVCKDGTEFKGVNVENASYGATICAERSAIVSAVSAGYKKDDFKELHIKASSGQAVTPCFLCRQVLEEFFDDDVIVYCYSDDNVEKYTKAQLCPHPFGSDDL